MAHVAVVGSFSDFSDHVGHSIVIIGDIIIFFHGDADLFERIFRRGAARKVVMTAGKPIDQIFRFPGWRISR